MLPFVSEIADLPRWVFFIAPLALWITHSIIIGIYNVYFHPLAKFPGPKYASFNFLYTAFSSLSGYHPFIVHRLHKKYGPVVRISPNVVSFNTATSWRDLYGRHGNRKFFLKSPVYDSPEGKPPSIASIRDPVGHSEIKKLLSHGFSPKALADQEDIVHKYVDLLIRQIGTHATGSEGDEMVKWYNFTTFDIIGDLAFGEPFGSLNDGRPHFWVSTIIDALAGMAWVSAMSRLLGNSKLALRIIKWMVPRKLIRQRDRHLAYSRDKIIRRMNSKITRKDFLTDFLRVERTKWHTVESLEQQSQTLIIAGSETTATFLSGATFYLCTTPHSLQKLSDEIRGTFPSYNSITGVSTEHCRYLKAVIDEALRIFPPVPSGLSRISPGETIDGFYIPEGAEAVTTPYSATHSEENFHDPYEFLPERWLDSDCKDRKEASQPFLLGPRVCLGRPLAMLEMRVILAKLIWTYDMELLEKSLEWEKKCTTTLLWRKPDLWVRFKRRQGAMVPGLD